MKKGTKESIVDASSDYLTDYLPDNYDTWTKEKLYKYLENNSSICKSLIICSPRSVQNVSLYLLL